METIAYKPSKTLNISLWVAQIVLAGMFIMAGAMKTFTPIDELGANLPWVKELPTLVRFIGVSELLGGLGLILPSLLRIKPILTPLAALGIVIIMILAAIYHGAMGEFQGIGMNAVLGLLAAFVAWGRFKKVPILPRS